MIEYPVDKVVKEFDRVKFYHGAGPLSYVIRRELESARPHLTPFQHLFGPPLRAGKLSILDAVEAYLKMPQEVIEDQFIRAFRK